MKKRFFMAALALLTLGGSVTADELQQQLTIDGSPVEKTVAEITFNGDNVVLHFGDSSEETVTMNSVLITFVTPTGISEVSAYDKLVGDQFTLAGIPVGTAIEIYNVNGTLVYNDTANGETVLLTVNSLPSGTYLLKAGNHIVKFSKR